MKTIFLSLLTTCIFSFCSISADTRGTTVRSETIVFTDPSSRAIAENGVFFFPLPPDKEKKAMTSLYLISSDQNEKQGLGNFEIYSEDDGEFSIFNRDKGNGVVIKYHQIIQNDGKWINCHADFGAPFGQILKPGVYNKAFRLGDHFTPRLNFIWLGLGCYTSIGNFEVFEIVTNEEGKIESFAANFTQHCESYKAPPLFGAVRYNSSIPVEAKKSEIFGRRLPPVACLYVKESGSKARLMNSDKSNFAIGTYSDFSDGMIFAIKDNFQHWILELNIDKEIGFFTGLHEKDNDNKKSPRLFNGCPGDPKKISLIISEIHTNEYTTGEYKILKLEKDAKGEIEELALNFKMKHSLDDKFIEGALRLNSDFPINLDKPFN